MKKLVSTLALTFCVALVATMLLVPTTEARPKCPSDGIVHTTSGSTGYGATCNDAFIALNQQESAKIDCPYGMFDRNFVHNGCHWNGSSYQATGWFTYECQTDCYGEPQQ
jgi:hypothetical protein